MKNLLLIASIALYLNIYSQVYNVGLNQTYSASVMDTTIAANHDPQHAFDNDTLTWWEALDWPVHWIAVHFSEPTSIDSATFWYGQNPAANTTQEYYITYDNINWVLHETAVHFHSLGNNDNYPHYTHVFSTPISGALGYKVQTTVSPSWVQWREIKLWGFQCSFVDMNVTQTGVTLTADQNNATYQWIDCDNNNSPISGETNQSYTPTVTGNYAVEITLNGCNSVSECVLVDFTGVDELLNPTMKKLVKIVNLLGQEVEYTPNTVLIYQYSDGTSEKVFTIED